MLAPYDMSPPATTFSLTWYAPGSRFLARKSMNPSDVELVQRVGGHRERIGPLPHHRGEGGVELVGAANRDKQQLHAQQLCDSFRSGETSPAFCCAG